MPDLLIDLDNTIYSETEEIFSQIDLKMKSFISSELNVSLEKAYNIQKRYFLKYGTTLRGLMVNHNIKPSFFLKYVHDINLKPIKKNLLLKSELKRFKGKKIIFTNGTTEHAINVLKRVGVLKEIDNIFDIKDADYIPKPDLLPYKKVVNKFKIIPHNTIMIDDIKANLVTAKKLGIGTVLVNKKQPKLTKNIIDYSFSDIASIIKKINNKEIFNEN
jgi:putative hydrolase of the HAD superfamily